MVTYLKYSFYDLILRVIEHLKTVKIKFLKISLYLKSEVRYCYQSKHFMLVLYGLVCLEIGQNLSNLYVLGMKLFSRIGIFLELG